MELAIQIQIEELPEGLFLATSDELPGLVAQGRTVAEALEIARDVARKLIEARRERDGVPNLPTTSERRDYTIVDGVAQAARCHVRQRVAGPATLPGVRRSGVGQTGIHRPVEEAGRRPGGGRSAAQSSGPP